LLDELSLTARLKVTYYLSQREEDKILSPLEEGLKDTGYLYGNTPWFLLLISEADKMFPGRAITSIQ